MNELLLDALARPNVDQWGTVMPPFDPSCYEGEAPGTVLRYRDGEIEVARGYYWERDSLDLNSPLKPAGSIYLTGGNDPPWEMTKYSQFTVFNCWRPLPCVYMEEDPLCSLISPYGADSGPGLYGEGRRLNLMSFEDPDITGITHIALGGNSQVVAGRQPSWMPSLVPEMFRNPDRHAPISRGLGGLLPVIIGQMALTQPKGQTDRPFASQWWHRRHWRRQNLGTTGEAAQLHLVCQLTMSCNLLIWFEVSHPLDIRAVVVHVALDEIDNPEGSTRETLENFEAGTVVRES